MMEDVGNVVDRDKEVGRPHVTTAEVELEFNSSFILNAPKCRGIGIENNINLVVALVMLVQAPILWGYFNIKDEFKQSGGVASLVGHAQTKIGSGHTQAENGRGTEDVLGSNIILVELEDRDRRRVTFNGFVVACSGPLS
ncbi:hypothetical protein VNO78_25117 [Psophocarpus tetragonolobus]|uniref:Uncharacterized protein n=1 Tax=Psophocarpus tetragonolobus TaxID=3891 RepID=A0AAN9S9I2_PSOTE